MNRIEPVDKSRDAAPGSSPTRGERAGTAEDRRAWISTALILAAGAGALIWAFRETAGMLIRNWDSAAYNHGYLIVPISLYVAWERRFQILPMRPMPTRWGLMPALGFAVIWSLGDVVDVNLVKEFGLIGLFQSLIFTVLGWRVSRALMFPILYTWLMLPFGDSLYPPLQYIATQLTVFFLSLTSLPSFNEDAIIYVPSGTYRIAEVCAGLNFILSTIALSLIYGTLMYRGWIKRVACLAVMLPLSIVGNGFRIFLIIYANHFLGANIDIVEDHYFYGWGFIGIIFLVMMWVGLAFRDPESVDAPPTGALAGRLGGRHMAGIAASAVAVVLLGVAAPTWSAYRDSRQAMPPVVALTVPTPLSGQLVLAENQNPMPWQPRFPQADATILQRYLPGTNRSAAIDLFVAYYGAQTRDKEVVSFRNKLGDEKPWGYVGGSAQTASVAGENLKVREDRLHSGNETRLVWSFYWIGGHMTASKTEAKLLQAWNELSGGDRRAAVVALSTLDDGDRDATRQRIQDSFKALPLADILESATK